MGHYESYLAACPYYCKEENMKVRCQGWEEGVSISVRFASVEISKRHKENCCRNLKGCSDCPLKQMLDFEIGNREAT